MKLIRHISRIITGIVFIFSGIVKGVDPMGTAYKFNDYFLAMNLNWLIDFAFALAVILIAAEFIIGWLLLFNIKTSVNAWFVLFFMLLFTPLTLWLAVSNKVDDCGCFGDFLVMTNWETFYKNIVILVIVLLLFFTRRKFSNDSRKWKQVLIGLIGTAIIFIIMYDAHNHLPRFDFRPFYRGAHISENMLPQPEIADIKLVYRNVKTGEEHSYTPQNLPYNDSVLWPDLEFIRQEKEVIQEFKEASAAFEILGKEGKDYSSEIIGSPDFLFVIIMHDIRKANKKAFKDINTLIEQASRRNIKVIAITGSLYDEVEAFMEEVNTPVDHYSSDVIKLKTVIRSNPGIILLRNGYLVDKWHYNDIPDLDTYELQAPFDAFTGK